MTQTWFLEHVPIEWLSSIVAPRISKWNFTYFLINKVRTKLKGYPPPKVTIMCILTIAKFILYSLRFLTNYVLWLILYIIVDILSIPDEVDLLGTPLPLHLELTPQQTETLATQFAQQSQKVIGCPDCIEKKN